MVLLVLILTLRALAAPLYLLASVVLSCAAALGLTTLVFQHLLGQGIHFSVPVIAFVLLVAVGADYNILLMSRMRESGLALTRDEVARAVTATGPVITAAGVIFASTFVALLFSPVEALAQTGFAVAAGLLLDTFIVRTLVVPACAALFEERSWWPHRNLTGRVPPQPPRKPRHAHEAFDQRVHCGSLISHRENFGTNFARLMATDLNAGERPRIVANEPDAFASDAAVDGGVDLSVGPVKVVRANQFHTQTKRVVIPGGRLPTLARECHTHRQAAPLQTQRQDPVRRSLDGRVLALQRSGCRDLK